MLTTYIYSLSDPRTNEIRYVGKAINLKARIKEHHRRKLLRHNNTHKGNWLLSLYALGLEPVVNVLEIVVGDAWGQRERWWINHLKFQCRLTNYTLGGEGVPGRIKSADEIERQRQKLIGRTLPAEHRALIGIGLKKHYAMIGRLPMTQAQKAKISKTLMGRKTGRILSDAAKAKMSAGKRALSQVDPDYWIKLNAPRKGKPQPSSTRIMKAHWAAMTPEQKLARGKAISEGRLKQIAATRR